MPAKRPARRAPAAPSRAAEIRRLSDEIAECAAVTLALMGRAEAAASAFASSVPPAIDPAVAAELVAALDAVRASARKGRSLARQLSVLVAPVVG